MFCYFSVFGDAQHLKSACDRVVPGAVGFWEDLKLVVEKVQLLYFGA